MKSRARSKRPPGAAIALLRTVSEERVVGAVWTMKNPLGVLRAGLRGHDGDPANRVALAPPSSRQSRPWRPFSVPGPRRLRRRKVKYEEAWRLACNSVTTANSAINVQVSPRAHAGPHGSSIPRSAHVHPRRPGNRPARQAVEREGGERVRRTRPGLGPFLGKPRRREHPGGPRGEPRRATVLPRSGPARLLGAPGGPGSRPDREQGRRPCSVRISPSTLDP